MAAGKIAACAVGCGLSRAIRGPNRTEPCCYEARARSSSRSRSTPDAIASISAHDARVRAEAERQDSSRGEGRDPERMPICDLGERVDLAHGSSQQRQVTARSGHVRDVDREHARSHRPALRQPLERPRHARQVVQQGVDLLGVVVALSVLGLRADRAEPLHGVGPVERQVDHEEGVAVGGRGDVLAGVMEADRHLCAELADRTCPPARAKSRRPPAIAVKHDVVDRDPLTESLRDPLQLVERARNERHHAARAGRCVERRDALASRSHLAPERRPEGEPAVASPLLHAAGEVTVRAAPVSVDRRAPVRSRAPSASIAGRPERAPARCPRLSTAGGSPSSTTWDRIRPAVIPSARQ